MATPPTPVPPVKVEEVTILDTGELQTVAPDTTEQPVAKPTSSQRPQQAPPPPTPVAALIPNFLYYALSNGKEPATTPQLAVRALASGINLDTLIHAASPFPGIYCLGRPTTTNVATTTDPNAPSVVIAYLPGNASPQTRPEQWTKDAFTIYANDVSIQQKTEFDRIKRKNLFILGGLSLATLTIAAGITYVGANKISDLQRQVDDSKYITMQEATAEDRQKIAETTLQKFIAGYTTLNQNLGLAIDNSSRITEQATSNKKLLDETIDLETTYWFQSDELEPRLVKAKALLIGYKPELDEMEAIIKKSHEIPAVIKQGRDALQSRYSLWQQGNTLVQRFEKSNADMNKQQVAYLKALKDQTKRELEASITTQLAGNPDPQMFHATVAAYAQFTAENTAKPVNPNVGYNGGKIDIKADNCIDATATLANVLAMSVPQKERFIAVEQSSCKPNGQDLKTQANFNGTYHWGN